MNRWLKQAGTVLNVWRNNRRAPYEIEAQQRARLAALVDFARANSPYYKKLYRNLPATLEDAALLPPVSKPGLMAHFDEWVTDPAVTQEGLKAFLGDNSLVGQFFLGKYAACFTSGTTGVRGMFVQDRNSMDVGKALTLARGLASLSGLRKSLGGPSGRGRRQASVIATGGHYATFSITERVRRQFPRQAKNSRTFSVLTALPELVRGLNEFQPSVLSGYPNAITVLAHEKEAGRLRIDPGLVVTFSETLDDTARDRIGEIFGCVVRSWYGAAEAESIAYDCGHDWLHLNADWIILEPVDADYRPVPPGQESDTVLLTNLANRVQPILRYDLGDRILFKPERCACGSPLPAIRIGGRLHDIPLFTSPEGEQHKMMPVLLSTACIETPGVQRHQVVQTQADRLVVRFEPRPGHDKNEIWEDLSARLRGRLIDQDLSFVDVVLDPDPPRTDPRSGKFRTFAVEMTDAADPAEFAEPTLSGARLE